MTKRAPRVSGTRMAEKSKWFDRKPVPDIPLRLYASSGVLYRDSQKFLEDVSTLYRRGRLPDDSFKLFEQLCQMPPAVRLGRNLKVVLTILADRPVRNIIHDGLTEAERLALRDLEHLAAPTVVKATAQGLLNVNERQQMAEALADMFRDERTRHWGQVDE